LEKASGVSRTTLAKIRDGRTSPEEPTLRRIAGVLGVSPPILRRTATTGPIADQARDDPSPTGGGDIPKVFNGKSLTVLAERVAACVEQTIRKNELQTPEARLALAGAVHKFAEELLRAGADVSCLALLASQLKDLPPIGG
jgi:transcriptional regulator with XRE-family HTH domain